MPTETDAIDGALRGLLKKREALREELAALEGELRSNRAELEKLETAIRGLETAARALKPVSNPPKPAKPMKEEVRDQAPRAYVHGAFILKQGSLAAAAAEVLLKKPNLTIDDLLAELVNQGHGQGAGDFRPVLNSMLWRRKTFFLKDEEGRFNLASKDYVVAE